MFKELASARNARRRKQGGVEGDFGIHGESGRMGSAPRGKVGVRYRKEEEAVKKYKEEEEEKRKYKEEEKKRWWSRSTRNRKEGEGRGEAQDN